MVRVLKPVGFIGVRDMDWGGNIFYPEDPIIHKALELREKAITHMGGNYRIGRTHRKLLLDSGLTNIVANPSCETMGNPEKLQLISDYLAAQWKTAPFAKLVKDKGWATEKQICEFQRVLQNFPQQEGAFRSWTWCHAIGYKALS
jgi:hypothetical protein